MRPKTVMVNPETWQWLKEHRGAGSISELIQGLITEHVNKKADTPGLRPEESGKAKEPELNQA